ncbi:MAG: nucleoside 2-deoxyribosyltransferase [Xanthobacteraceae bacterium]
MQAAMPRVYLAGPGVFRPDAKAFGRGLQAKCERAGLAGCFPLDNAVDGDTPRDIAAAILRANVDLIDSSRAIIADISSFRGPNMDPGTAWEIGYGVARGLPVYAWSSDRTHLRERTERHLGARDPSRRGRDADGWSIEDFGLIENLMIALSVTSLHGSEDEAIRACADAIARSA